jgi:hypothetical protein
MNEIIGYKIEASDGELGHAKDFLFDDHSWVVRYLVRKQANASRSDGSQSGLLLCA